MPNTTVSVLIPTYNRPHTLAEALEALRLQTVQPTEIIIVNDAGESVEEAVAQYPELPIAVKNLPENSGHVRARNVALSHATGEYVMLLDDDDLIIPGHLEHMLQAISMSEADFVYSDVEIFDYRTEGFTRVPTTRRLFSYHFNESLLRHFNTIVTSGTLYRRAIHDRIGEFDEDVHNYWDWDFCLRVLEGGYRMHRVSIAGTLYAFSPGGGNQSGEMTSRREGYLRTLCEKHGLGELPMKNFFLMLEDPEIKQYEADSERLWDGLPIVSRYADAQNAFGG